MIIVIFPYPQYNTPFQNKKPLKVRTQNRLFQASIQFKFTMHAVVKDVSLPGQGTLFVNNPGYIYIPDLAPTAVNLVN